MHRPEMGPEIGDVAAGPATQGADRETRMFVFVVTQRRGAAVGPTTDVTGVPAAVICAENGVSGADDRGVRSRRSGCQEQTNGVSGADDRGVRSRRSGCQEQTSRVSGADERGVRSRRTGCQEQTSGMSGVDEQMECRVHSEHL